MARIWHRKTYGGESERVDFDTERRNVLLLELSGQMTLDEGGLGAGLSVNVLWLGRMQALLTAHPPQWAGCYRNRMQNGMAYLSSTTVTDKHELEGRAAGLGGSLGHGVGCCGGREVWTRRDAQRLWK